MCLVLASAAIIAAPALISESFLSTIIVPAGKQGHKRAKGQGY